MIKDLANVKSSFLIAMEEDEEFITQISGILLGLRTTNDVYVNAIYPTKAIFNKEVVSRLPFVKEKSKEFYKKYEELGQGLEKIMDWYDEVGMDASTLEAQKIKLYEELGELALAFRKKNIEEIKDAVIDTIIVKAMMERMTGYSKRVVMANVINGVMNAEVFNYFNSTNIISKMNAILDFVDKAVNSNIVELCINSGRFFKDKEEYVSYFYKVGSIIHSRINGIVLDEFGFAIKKEDRD